jgi:hypothetical protein
VYQIVKHLLSEKLIDDFYDESRDREQVPQNMWSLTERLKEHLPMDQHELLYRWEAECTEHCSQGLRQFADFVAALMAHHKTYDESSCED